MSRLFRDKNKDLVRLKVVTSDKVWTTTKSGKPIIRKDIGLYGRVDKGTSAFITSTNLSGKNHKIIDDTINLPKKVKNDVVDLLINKHRKVAYLIQTDKNKKRGN
jgi:hypothetical protein